MPISNRDEALAFVERHGVVLEAARGPVPNLAEQIAGEHIRGSWWGHPNSPLKKPKEPFDKLRVSGKSPVESGWGSAHAEPVEAVGGVLQRAAKGHAIHRITTAVRESPDVLVCRLIAGNVTFAHRRMWPALVRLAHELDAQRLAAITERHTPSGAHAVVTVRFPRWVPRDVMERAQKISVEQARAQVGPWFDEQRRPSRSR